MDPPCGTPPNRLEEQTGVPLRDLAVFGNSMTFLGPPCEPPETPLKPFWDPPWEPLPPAS